jgi:hypothetical protein
MGHGGRDSKGPNNSAHNERRPANTYKTHTRSTHSHETRKLNCPPACAITANASPSEDLSGVLLHSRTMHTQPRNSHKTLAVLAGENMFPLRVASKCKYLTVGALSAAATIASLIQPQTIARANAS